MSLWSGEKGGGLRNLLLFLGDQTLLVSSGYVYQSSSWGKDSSHFTCLFALPIHVYLVGLVQSECGILGGIHVGVAAFVQCHCPFAAWANTEP